ncbi:hypothetical protein ACIQGO_26180 [Streptomyces shenzhenensis]|uniref:hypothetical protein n=1 Tax=Streptomyces shenzhenensis TaxID=943815 RepID=UPI0038036B1C
MRLRFWLGRAAAAVLKLLIQLGAFSVGPLPGIHYPDPGPDPDRTPRDAGLPETPHGPPAWHPEGPCTSPPSQTERELWAGLGIDVKHTGS